MNIPESFVEKLNTEFRNRLRVRWSQERSCYLVEQKVRRGAFSGFRPKKKGWDETVDKFVQARDGVIEVMQVAAGTNMECPSCKHALKVPFGSTEHIKCAYCKLIGKKSAVAAIFLPLGDKLIDYLKQRDPENPLSERLAQDLLLQNDAMSDEMERQLMSKALDETTAAFSDRYNRLVGIPQTGYTGRIFKG